MTDQESPNPEPKNYVGDPDAPWTDRRGNPDADCWKPLREYMPTPAADKKAGQK
jgi:hypothetical protein